MQVAEFVQQQNAAIEGSRTLMNSLFEEVGTHRDNFKNGG